MTCEACKAAEAIYESGCPGCEARALDSINQGVGMQRDDISMLAESAGLNYSVDLQFDGKHHIRLDGWPEDFERFAQLVAAQEREQCAKLAKSLWYIDGQYTADEFAEAIRNRGNA